MGWSRPQGLVGPVVPRVVLDGDGLPSSASYGPERSDLRVSRRELVKTAGITEELLEQLEAYGLVRTRTGSQHYDGEALVIARTAGELAAFGIEPRHLRAFKTAAAVFGVSLATCGFHLLRMRTHREQAGSPW